MENIVLTVDQQERIKWEHNLRKGLIEQMHTITAQIDASNATTKLIMEESEPK